MSHANLSIGVAIQPVRPDNLFRLRPEYMWNLADSINQVVYKSDYSPDCILTDDLVCLADNTERVKTYIVFNEQAYKQFIQLMGQYYQRSPNERKTELPLMFLTDTQTILMRRIKRLKKLQKQTLQYYNSSQISEGETSQKSYMPNSRNEYLESHLSTKSLQSLAESSSSDYSTNSYYDIFRPEYSSNQSDPIDHLDQLTDRAKQKQNWMKNKKVNQESSTQLVNNIKSATESKLEHLIIKYSNQQSTEKSEDQPSDHTLICRSCGKCKLCIKLNSNPHSQPSSQRPSLTKKYLHQFGMLPNEVRSGVTHELQKLSLKSTPIGSTVLSNGKKKISEKAVEMLREMGMPLRQ